ncbi:MAG: hypothetical protein H7Y38_14430 [Armatimonadetes bacterium]|nr:hypothetical protein [Armatimonadota bacterium]
MARLRAGATRRVLVRHGADFDGRDCAGSDCQGGAAIAVLSKTIGWQGYTVQVPVEWDMTGYSGTSGEGYFRVDDGENLSLEVKWATEKAPISLIPWAKPGAVKPPDVEIRREAYFKRLRDAAKKKKLVLTTKDADAPRSVTVRPERSVAGFTWTGDKRAIGAIWYCAVCHRVTIAQVTGDVSGKGGLVGKSDAVMGSMACHDAVNGQRVWAIYDLDTTVPTDYELVTAQLMNVYLRLSFVKNHTARLSVEQWAVANVARKEAFLDDWVAANAKGELRQARYSVSEGRVRDLAAVTYTGGPAFGQPMIEVVQELTRFQKPATRFSGVAWEDESANKMYLVQARRPRSEPDPVAAVAGATK